MFALVFHVKQSHKIVFHVKHCFFLAFVFHVKHCLVSFCLLLRFLLALCQRFAFCLALCQDGPPPRRALYDFPQGLFCSIFKVLAGLQARRAFFFFNFPLALAFVHSIGNADKACCPLVLFTFTRETGKPLDRLDFACCLIVAIR